MARINSQNIIELPIDGAGTRMYRSTILAGSTTISFRIKFPQRLQGKKVYLQVVEEEQRP